MKSDIQKEWEKVYGKKQNYDISGEYYYNDHGRFRKGSKGRKILRGIGTIILIILILFLKGYFKVYTSSSGTTKIGVSNAINQSNKNGIIMHNSIETISEIITNTTSIINIHDSNSISTLNNYIIQVSELNLSKEYDSFKNAIISKIQYAIYFINTSNKNEMNSILLNYKNISYIDELKNCFDEANVKYNINNNSIEYQYIKK